MSQWTPENIIALVTAIAGMATAIGALIHSKNTRKGIAETDIDNAIKTSK